MDKDKLDKFFEDILQSEGYISSESMDVFRQLIDLTLQFRDNLKAETGRILTVGETRRALDIYLKAVKEGRISTNLDDRIEALVRLWLKEINGITF
jgi:hypothetical protein